MEIVLGCLASYLVVLVAMVTCLLLASSLSTLHLKSFLKVSGLFLERDLCSPTPEKILSYWTKVSWNSGAIKISQSGEDILTDGLQFWQNSVTNKDSEWEHRKYRKAFRHSWWKVQRETGEEEADNRMSLNLQDGYPLFPAAFQAHCFSPVQNKTKNKVESVLGHSGPPKVLGNKRSPISTQEGV